MSDGRTSSVFTLLTANTLALNIIPSSPSNIGNIQGGLYTNAIAGNNELFYIDNNGNITQITSASGGTGVIGSGAANQISFWTAANAISGSSNFTWNNTFSTFALTGTSTFTIAPNQAAPFRVIESGVGSPNYIGIVTTTGVQAINFGNTTDNPFYAFLGSGSAKFSGNVFLNNNKHINFGNVGSGVGLAPGATQFEMGIDNVGAFHVNVPNGTPIYFSFNGTTVHTFQEYGCFDILQPAFNGGIDSTIMRITGGAHTALNPTSTSDIQLNLNRVIQFSSAISPLTNIEAIEIDPPTYAFNAAGTINSASTVAITGAPVQGTNNTLSASVALAIQSNNVGSASQAFGLLCAAPTGASASWSARFIGPQLDIRDATNTYGVLFTPTSGNTTVNTSTTGNNYILFQNQTFTPGATYGAVQITPTFTSENFIHQSLRVVTLQVAPNTQTIRGMFISAQTQAGTAGTMNQSWGIEAQIGCGSTSTMTTAACYYANTPTGTGTLVNNYGFNINNQSVSGGTTAYGINIQNQVANATTTAAINIAGTGANNAIIWAGGTSSKLFSNGVNNIRMTENTGVGGLDIGLSTTQQGISSLAGNLGLTVPSGAAVQSVVNSVVQVSVSGTDLQFNNGLTGHVKTIGAGNYTVLNTDFILIKTAITGGGDTVTLPNAASVNAGKILGIKDGSNTAGTNNITIASAGGNIDGASTYVMNSNLKYIEVVSDGTNWNIK